jgi:hypothetical protein
LDEMANGAEGDGEGSASVRSNETSPNSILDDDRGDIGYDHDSSYEPEGGENNLDQGDMTPTNASTDLASHAEYIQTRQRPLSTQKTDRRCRRSPQELAQGHEFIKARLERGMDFESIRDEWNKNFKKTRSVDDIQKFYEKGPPKKRPGKLVVLYLPPSRTRHLMNGVAHNSRCRLKMADLTNRRSYAQPRVPQ